MQQDKLKSHLDKATNRLDETKGMLDAVRDIGANSRISDEAYFRMITLLGRAEKLVLEAQVQIGRAFATPMDLH